jgi:acetoin utilization deacetylase AcuC-like enzyme
MAGLNLVEDDYAWVTTRLREVAECYSRSRIVSMLEGGYDLPMLGRSVMTHIKALI